MHLGALGQAFEQGVGVLDRAFGQRPVLEGENPVAVGQGQALAQLPGVGVVRIPQLAVAARRARRRAVDEDEEWPGGGGQRGGAGNRHERQRVASGDAVKTRRLVLERFFLESFADLAGHLFADVDTKKFQHAYGQPGCPAFADDGAARRQMGEFPGAAFTARRRVAVFAGQVVGPAPQYEAVFKRDADDGFRFDLDFLAGPVAGAARRQAVKRLRPAGLAGTAAASADFRAANAYRPCAHFGSPLVLPEAKG